MRVLSRFGVFFVARSPTAGDVTPHVGLMRAGQSKSWMEMLEEQIPPGGVVLYLLHFEGGPPSSCNFSPDAVANDVVAQVDSLYPERSERGSWVFSTYKWNAGWTALVLENDASQEESEAALELLRSLTFHDTPVVRPGQASSLAYAALARSLEPPERMNVYVSRDDGGFIVKLGECLSRCQPTYGPTLEPREWWYRVSSDGNVEPVEAR